MQYRREIDGLRAIAILPVLLFHAGLSFAQGGFLGVDVFFVISGYLITLHLLTDLEHQRFSLVKFYEKRARRILPALFFMVFIVTIGVWVIMLPKELELYSHSLISTIFFVANVFFAFTVDYFSGRSETYPLLHMWSLAIEEQFYLVFPVFLWVFFRFGKNVLLAVTLLCLVASIGLLEWSEGAHFRYFFYASPMRAWELLAGSCCALLWKRYNEIKLPQFVVYGAFLLLLSVFYWGKPGVALHLYVTILSTSLLLLGVRSHDVAGKVLTWKPLVGVGLISFSLYLWHQPILAFLRLSFPVWGIDDNDFVKTSVLFIGLIVAVGISVFSWFCIEQPFRSKGPKTRFTRAQIFSMSGVGIVGFLLAAVPGIWLEGGKQFYAVEDQELVSISYLERGKYLDDEYFKHDKTVFSTEGRLPRVVIVGDSYSKDFTNLLFYAHPDIMEKAEIYTHFLTFRCGNLMLDRDILPLVPKVHQVYCAEKVWYKDPLLLENLSKADYVIEASFWKDWEFPYLLESFSNIEKSTPGMVITLGAKRFGKIRPRTLLTVPPEERPSFRNNVRADVVRLEPKVRALGLPNYINLQKIICGALETCSVFTPEGDLISYDSSHLTEAGVAYLASRVFEDKGWDGTIFSLRKTDVE